ncbi:hypothetical protein FY034_18870 (plasmid) [Trichlorobacter lovleyi]|uniref:hypothetical protein n=1 Tax=Trichlorobacter lovleyi TaxID=313985 RepID=UPI00223EECAC|nr:hypothetical protein [Trichlorobacter lovleyi]QOX81041.1 hypothetical protein FY034_18870 [Trichlorobacter lovleyi]
MLDNEKRTVDEMNMTMGRWMAAGVIGCTALLAPVFLGAAYGLWAKTDPRIGSAIIFIGISWTCFCGWKAGKAHLKNVEETVNE